MILSLPFESPKMSQVDQADLKSTPVFLGSHQSTHFRVVVGKRSNCLDSLMAFG